ncbi:unnamed protein product, partial [Symbiodinium microadriaticum]
MQALQRLRSFDRNGDLAELAQSLEAKFIELATPTKEAAPSVSTATPGCSPGPGSSQPSPTEVLDSNSDAVETPAAATGNQKVSEGKAAEAPKPKPTIVETSATEANNTATEDPKEKATQASEKEADKKDEDKKDEAEAKQGEDNKGPDAEALTEKEAKKAEELQKRKKAAHARYMRYYRSVRESPRTPVEIRRMGDKAKNDSAMNSVLFEAWEKCQGDWKTSSIYLNLKSISRTRRTGVRVWMTRAEVIAKFGETSADAIILRKQGDEKLRKSEIRRHPELPESDELVQFLILDTSKFVEEEEEIMEQLYQAADNDSSSSSSGSSEALKKKAIRFNDKKQSKSKKEKTSKKDKKTKKEQKTIKGGKKRAENKQDKEIDEVLEDLKQRQEEDKKLVITKAGKKIGEYKAAQEECAKLGEHVREAAEKDLKESLDGLKDKRQILQEAVDQKDYPGLEKSTESLQAAIEQFESVMKLMEQVFKNGWRRWAILLNDLVKYDAGVPAVQESKGQCSRTTRKLAKFSGKNDSRDFYRSGCPKFLFGDGMMGDADEPKLVKCPVVPQGANATATYEMMDIPLLYPHEVLHYIHSVVGIKTDKDIIRKYWEFAAEKGPLLVLPNFGLDVIRMCSMHNLNLGLVFIANGSSLYTLVKAGWYGDPSENLGKLFEAAYVDFKAWLKEVKIYSSQRRFKYGLIMKKRDGGLRAPSMSCKAWNGRIVAEYLASVRAGAASFSSDPKIPLQAVAMTALARFFGLSERMPRLLTRGEANQQYHEGMLFINKSLELAQVSVRQQELTWNVVPKLHYFEHQLLETKRTCMNMRYHHCFTDEDAMRWTKLLARKVNPGTFEAAMMKKSISRLK